MLQIDQTFIDSAAPNANAVVNARSLVASGQFLSLHKSEDDSLLFGLCGGSGRTIYHCSCDFVSVDKVIYRCTCPSRQFPCKHCVALLVAFAQGKPFAITGVPADIVSKREKLQKKSERQAADTKKPRKVNKSALRKKIQSQLDGLNLLERLLHDLVRLGMGNMNAKAVANIQHQIKQLGDAYLPGAQTALLAYTTLFADEQGRFDSAVAAQARESIYWKALDRLTQLNALLKQGRAYLAARLDDPQLGPETESTIAAWLGHAWQLRELNEAGLLQNEARLIQLAFYCYDDAARREFVDTGIWMNLQNGQIGLTQNYRPYKAMRFIQADDSCFSVLEVAELYIYPGDINPRIRWNAMQSRPVQPSDLHTLVFYGQPRFADAIRKIKSHLKTPLADRHPIVALNFHRIGTIGNELVVEDVEQTRILLTDEGQTGEPPSCHLLRLLPTKLLTNQTLVVRFHQNLQDRTLRVKPLSLVSAEQVLRLTY